MGKLRVFAKEKERRYLWNMAGDHGPDWRTAVVQIDVWSKPEVIRDHVICYNDNVYLMTTLLPNSIYLINNGPFHLNKNCKGKIYH